MLHYMKLNPSPFEKMKAGEKVIEIRLNDERRRQLQVGDEIKFRLISDEKECLKTQVVDLSVFPTFKEMFLAFPPEEYGSKSQKEYKDMYQFYTSEDEKKYGVLAIRIQRIPI
jgi:ASC-1-like (ASCH) protein